AWRASRRDPSIELRQSTPGSTEGLGPGRLSKLLLAGQVAAAVTLLLVAGLLSRNLSQLVSSYPGFDPEGLVVATFEVPSDRIPPSELDTRLLEPLRARLQSEGGLAAVGLISNAPMSRPTISQRYREVGSDPTVEARSAAWRAITPDIL